jgi:hypothetical protein
MQTSAELLRPTAELVRRGLPTQVSLLLMFVMFGANEMNTRHGVAGGAIVVVCGLGALAAARGLALNSRLLRIAEAPCPRWVPWTARAGGLLGAAIVLLGLAILTGVWRPAP